MLNRAHALQSPSAPAPPYRRRRRLPLIAVVALLAGCQSIADFTDEVGITASSEDEPAVADTSPDGRAAAASDQTVGLDASEIKQLQAKLAELGFEPGPADGIIGPQTTGAIERFQRARGQPVTGAVTRQLLDQLASKPPERSADAQSPSRIEPAGLPRYRPGTTFIYSNGKIDRVADITGAAVKWVRSDGTSYTTDRNFLLPWSSWDTAKQRGTASIAGDADSDSLWPSGTGDVVSFSSAVDEQRRDNPDTVEQRVDRWNCRNEGRRDVSVPAGDFAAQVFVCTRTASRTVPQMVRTWYYAKTAQHFVRFVESVPSQNATRTVDLVAVRPAAPDWPPIVRAGLGRAVITALESPKENARVEWRSSNVATTVTIAATSRYVAPNGRPCRRFEQTWSEKDGSRRYHAVACKSASGQWQIPGLENDTAELLVTSGEMS